MAAISAGPGRMPVRGTVVGLWRYPVKSMLGERCEQIAVDRRGVAGDRRFAVQAADGKLGSGKNTRRFRKIDGLFAFRATYLARLPQVCFPDGRRMSGDDPGLEAALSEALGRSVRLVQEAEVSHFDDGALHLLSRGSLADLQGVAPEGAADARRFRPNIVLSTAGGRPEQGWLGKSLRVGQVALKITKATERCGMVSFSQDELIEAPQVLRHIAQRFALALGVYAEVLSPGLIRLGDEVVEV